MKKVFKTVLILLLIVVIAFGVFLGFLTATEYKPADEEVLELQTLNLAAEPVPVSGLTVLSWNIGYAGLGREQDFFMDGGTHARPGSAEIVNRYLDGIRSSIAGQNVDLVMLQEVDTDSARTYGIDETTALIRNTGVHALNYSCPFVPLPPKTPMGKVHSGLFTTTDYAVSGAERIALPCPFSWPLSTANLKRCLLISRLPVEDGNRELVLVNLHLEAYDDGEGKAAQTRQLMALLQEEYEKGNYVIAGGDFNQAFPGTLERYPNNHPDLWEIPLLEEASLPVGFRFVFDFNTPSCRLLNQPFSPADTENTQYYVIDGFIVSPNIAINAVETLDLGFENSDHNPVRLTVDLIP